MGTEGFKFAEEWWTRLARLLRSCRLRYISLFLVPAKTKTAMACRSWCFHYYHYYYCFDTQMIAIEELPLSTRHRRPIVGPISYVSLRRVLSQVVTVVQRLYLVVTLVD